MAYTINLTNGTVLATVADGTIDTDATNLKLVGKNFTGYGEILNENYVHMLENFSNTTAPTSPLTGQIWWNSDVGVLNVYDGTQFKAVSSSTVDVAEPTGAVEGDLWWNSADDQLYVYNGTVWVLIGPSFSTGSGTSGSIVEILTDTGTTDHVVVTSFVADTRVAITSKDSIFTPVDAQIFNDFGDIRPGVNLVSDVELPGARFVGTATNADLLDNLDSAQFLRSDVADITTEELRVQNDTGLRIGGADEVQISVDSNNANIFNRNVSSSMFIGTTDGGAAERISITISGTNGNVGLNNKQITDLADPTLDQDGATKAYVDDATTGDLDGEPIFADGTTEIAADILPDADNAWNLGSAPRRFDTIYATTFEGLATSANYADLAERFAADSSYAPGTVVMLGGVEEITAANEELSNDVFGVISTRPAHLMNAAAGDNETHPPVAMNGRVPVRVVGEVKKGDRLVSAGNGIARAASIDELTPFNVIGRSLDDKHTKGEGTIEAIVSMKS